MENIPAIARKAEFCFKWINSLYELRELRTARRETTVRSKEKSFHLERTVAPTRRLRLILCPWLALRENRDRRN